VMAGVRLAPADGGCPVALPPGESVLGRGPLLGITDKRVSRKHALLEVEGGRVRIKPIHVNPCFYQSPENGQLLPLEAHQWHPLKFGDTFSLLVDKYIFKVLSAHTRVLPSWMLEEDVMVQRLSDPIIKEGRERRNAFQIWSPFLKLYLWW
uniref:Aprataxin and PNK-like factor n=1 Tax=Nothoprocta perdicaria TaxID=30464 RepID=A0A8C7A5D6_NOTPE